MSQKPFYPVLCSPLHENLHVATTNYRTSDSSTCRDSFNSQKYLRWIWTIKILLLCLFICPVFFHFLSLAVSVPFGRGTSIPPCAAGTLGWEPPGPTKESLLPFTLVWKGTLGWVSPHSPPPSASLHTFKEAAWSSGKGAGLDIWRSRVQVLPWPLSGVVAR